MTMTRRSRAREVALQLLFQFDSNPGAPRPFVEQFVRERLKDPQLERFCMELFDGTAGKRDVIDGRLSQAAENWRVVRMSAVDRNILRLGAYELLAGSQPASVIINEAIELARRFGTKDSPSFVNGVLDRVKVQQEKAGAMPPLPSE
jgi:N utilization substance protein B